MKFQLYMLALILAGCGGGGGGSAPLSRAEIVDRQYQESVRHCGGKDKLFLFIEIPDGAFDWPADVPHDGKLVPVRVVCTDNAATVMVFDTAGVRVR